MAKGKMGWEAYQIEKVHKSLVLGYNCFLNKIWHQIQHLAPKYTSFSSC